MKKPKYIADLELAGMQWEEYVRARDWMAKHGVSVAYVPRRGWRFYCIGRPDGPTYVVCWVGVGALVDMLDQPSQTLKKIHEMGGNVK